MPKIKIQEPGSEPQSYSLSINREEISLGRSQENDIVLTHPSVSSHHAKIRKVIGGYILDDLASTNGTKWQKQRYKHLDLPASRHFQLADVDIDFLLSKEENLQVNQQGTFVSQQQAIEGFTPNDEKAPAPTSSPQPQKNSFKVAILAYLITLLLGLAILFALKQFPFH